MPLNVAVRRIRAPSRLAAMAATAKRIKEAGYARRPEMIKILTAGPDAKTATPEGGAIKPSPSWAAKK
jgi:hypothetical protein